MEIELVARHPDCELDELDEESRCYSQCQASRGDGECIWKDCPQLVNWKSHCPLDRLCVRHDAKWKALP